MDFEKVLPLIIGEFEKEKVNYGLIGGFAMGAMGIMRSTMDLDFLVDGNDLEKVAKIMRKYGYNCAYKSKDVSQYVATAKIFGEIDFLLALRPISREMLARAKRVMTFEGRLNLKVLAPEDIIGLKTQAIANNPSRETREFADIEIIMDYFGARLDWELLRGHFLLFEMEEKFKELRKKYGSAK